MSHSINEHKVKLPTLTLEIEPRMEMSAMVTSLPANH